MIWKETLNIRPVPIQSTRFTGFGGCYMDKKKKMYMDQLRGLVISRKPPTQLKGLVRFDVDFVFPFRKTDFKRQGDCFYMGETPDRGNLLKGIEDAIKDVVCEDDSKICDGRVRKYRLRGSEGAIVCTVTEINENEII